MNPSVEDLKRIESGIINAISNNPFFPPAFTGPTGMKWVIIECRLVLLDGIGMRFSITLSPLQADGKLTLPGLWTKLLFRYDDPLFREMLVSMEK